MLSFSASVASRAPLPAPLRCRVLCRANMASCSASSAPPPEGLSAGCRGAPLQPGTKLPLRGEESLMSQKAHGTCDKPVQSSLRWGCDVKLADRICWCVRASFRARRRARGSRAACCSCGATARQRSACSLSRARPASHSYNRHYAEARAVAVLRVLCARACALCAALGAR